MKKLLLSSCYAISFSAHASCNFYLSSFANIESGSVKVSKYDEVYESYHGQIIPITGININTYAFTSYGKAMNCSSGVYQGNQLFSLQFTPYCNKTLNSSDLTNVNDGEYYTQKCANNTSVDVLKKYDDSLIEISFVPTGFHAISFNSYTPNNAESSIIVFKVKNLIQPKNVNLGTLRPTLQDGYYRFDNGYGGSQGFLYNAITNESASINVYLAKNNNYFKLGNCSIVINMNNQLNIKCNTETNAKNYKIMSQYNSITVLDPAH